MQTFIQENDLLHFYQKTVHTDKTVHRWYARARAHTHTHAHTQTHTQTHTHTRKHNNNNNNNNQHNMVCYSKSRLLYKSPRGLT